ncbi:sugar kinase [Paenibacillus sp. MMS20-IR301]|uniref:carbohydrate kinase family protein n=1 Tax=Paenibacillus sp. MMS20-IR301 TaxID=2895946 RepID=UPI0028E46CAC|nr:sugar kinase [Paenibacillus sp. MMS20-IR301]WNS44223.1 sugar kinase [Paenibacillus sp. MMS20-IR301]
MFELDESVELREADIDLLTAGELLIDMISAEFDEEVQSGTYQRFFGGSPSNIAMNVKKLGIRSVVASAVGNDGLGNYLIRHLQHAGISTDCIQQVSQATSMVVLTKSKSTPVPIFYRGADYQLTYTRQLKHALMNSKILHFSSWPVSRLHSRGTIEQAIAQAKETGLLVCFDPNYHPMVWDEGGDGIRYIQGLISQADIIKPSEDDAERLFGKQSPETHVENFLKLGAKLVILTLGKDGAIVSNGRQTEHFPTMAKEIADTTGAGDAFWSGLYTGMVKGYTLRKAVQVGLATSAYKLKYIGAVVDLPDAESICQAYEL